MRHSFLSSKTKKLIKFITRTKGVVQSRQQCFLYMLKQNMEDDAHALTNKQTNNGIKSLNTMEWTSTSLYTRGEALPRASHMHIRAFGIHCRNSSGCNTLWLLQLQRRMRAPMPGRPSQLHQHALE